MAVGVCCVADGESQEKREEGGLSGCSEVGGVMVRTREIAALRGLTTREGFFAAALAGAAVA